MNRGLSREYWAKTSADGKPGISVLEHMRNVGYVARFLIEKRKNIMDFFSIDIASVSALAALHDVGKISQGFQRKCPVWLEENGLVDVNKAEVWDSAESDHSKVSQYSIQNYLKSIGIETGSAALWAAAVGAHHGRLHWSGSKGLNAAFGMKKDDWEDKRQREILHIIDEFGRTPTHNVNIVDSSELWWIAGLTSVADWIGSDERFFPVECNVFNPQEAAQKALENIGFIQPKIRQGLSFEDLFTFDEPNELQKIVQEIITEPGIYVIEAPMGIGKTEAALLCAYNLLCSGKANGIYFALPTQATSNRIHIRMSDFVNRIIEDGYSITRLIHGNSWLIENLSYPKSTLQVDDQNENGSAITRDWFASRKRALLAPFGVGTVDQALLSVVAARHFFVRRFALAGKVVIIDEVHSYDVYTGTLVRILCQELEKLGCTVILLSATLTGKRRDELLSLEEEERGDNCYPMVSGRSQKGVFKSSSIESPQSKEVQVEFSEHGNAIKEAIEVVARGGCILWICNTVTSAQNVYEEFHQNCADMAVDIGLLHSRYPFFRREELENYWMEILGKGKDKRKACILVSTQVVEQSVDLDADMMISELAPTDMLLQRLGRLWRHERSNRPLRAATFRIVAESRTLSEMQSISADEIKEVFGSKAYVYSPYILLRSWEVWEQRQSIKIPGDIRQMIEETYKDHEHEPDGWNKLSEDCFGLEYAERQMSLRESNIWQILLDDVEGVNTRLNEIPTIPLVLVRKLSNENAVLLDDSDVALKSEKFNIVTARAVNRNLVRVPRYSLATDDVKLKQNDFLKRYVQGECCWGILDGNGIVTITGIKPEYTFKYSDLEGVEIVKRGER